MDGVQRALRSLVGTGGSMKTFEENWPAMREVIAGAGIMQSSADAKAAGEQTLAALRAQQEPRA